MTWERMSLELEKSDKTFRNSNRKKGPVSKTVKVQTPAMKRAGRITWLLLRVRGQIAVNNSIRREMQDIARNHPEVNSLLKDYFLYALDASDHQMNHAYKQLQLISKTAARVHANTLAEQKKIST